MPTMGQAEPVVPANITIQDLEQLIAASKKDSLREWRLSQYNGDPVRWLEWFGQFENAKNSANISDDFKLTYLKTLVTGKGKTAVAEFAYYVTMYENALLTPEWTCGQPHAMVSFHLDKLSHFRKLKMHNSENIISYPTNILTLFGVFRSLYYFQD